MAISIGISNIPMYKLLNTHENKAKEKNPSKFCFYFFYLMSMYVSLYEVSIDAGKGNRSFRTGVTESYKLPCGYQEPNMSPLKMQPMMLTNDTFLYLL